EKIPYLVSTICDYKHPDPLKFSTTRSIADWKAGVLAVAGVSNYTEARRFLGISGQGEPQSSEPALPSASIRENFYPSVRTTSDLTFLMEQSILSASGTLPKEEILFRLIDKKGAFEWQQGVLTSWDGTTMHLLVNNQPKEFQLRPDVLIYQRVGNEHLAM